ncbi:MAG: hypothetical protein HLUCCO16_06690 [Phormidium sp. OSCR]|nr:MAG: hypothetical protein HLUCCO16_06690 [Phormidium sp. OSCR]
MNEALLKMGWMADGVAVSGILRLGGSRANSVMLMESGFRGFRFGAGVVRFGRSVLFLGGLAQMHLENCIVSGFWKGGLEIP